MLNTTVKFMQKNKNCQGLFNSTMVIDNIILKVVDNSLHEFEQN
jgi:hypothetical protein